MKSKAVGVIIGLGVVGAAAWAVLAGTYVGQGERGVIYTMSDGVREETLDPGFHFVSPFAKVKDYPVAQQQLVLSNNAADFNEDELEKDTHVDAPADGGMVKMNMSINYNFMPDRITDLYEKFNGMDGDQLVESRIKNSILAYIKEVTPQFSVMDIYSDKRAEIGQAITDYLNSKLNDEYGIEVTNELPKEQFDAIVLAVAHKEFVNMDMAPILGQKCVLFDVKGVCRKDSVDGRL